MSINSCDLSIITATHSRPSWLKNCCQQIRSQSVGNLNFEHIVVSDGPDPKAKSIAEGYGARYFALSKQKGLWGAYCKDFGIRVSRGRYLVFFDDDNIYFSHALAALYASAFCVDIGICQTIHGRQVIPPSGVEHLRFGNIDTMCLCVSRDIASRSRWRSCNSRGTDWNYLKGLLKLEPTCRIVPIVIGEHLV